MVLNESSDSDCTEAAAALAGTLHGGDVRCICVSTYTLTREGNKRQMESKRGV